MNKTETERYYVQKRILVVDGDEMNLMRTKRILEKQYEVLLVDSGEKALDKIKSEKIDLILLDIAMPGMDGIETFERMKNRRDKISVIFLKVSGDEDDVYSAIMLGRCVVASYRKGWLGNAL